MHGMGSRRVGHSRRTLLAAHARLEPTPPCLPTLPTRTSTCAWGRCGSPTTCLRWVQQCKGEREAWMGLAGLRRAHARRRAAAQVCCLAGDRLCSHAALSTCLLLPACTPRALLHPSSATLTPESRSTPSSTATACMRWRRTAPWPPCPTRPTTAACWRAWPRSCPASGDTGACVGGWVLRRVGGCGSEAWVCTVARPESLG